MTCHEKLMHFFFLLTQEVTTADVTHLALFLGIGVHFPWEDFVGHFLIAFFFFFKVFLQFAYIN